MKIIVQDKNLFESFVLRGKEVMLVEILNRARRPIRATELEKMYGSSAVYNTIYKLVRAGMLEKNEEGKYILSKKFSEILRRYAKEWENFVDG
jgi:DNA-binding IclR family transcriptional regulator